ncbi:TolC family protein, partial [Oxalobacteraceae bacterium]|nr:TolC family protein [Oxalobacteraceae bacterium]
SKLDGAVASNAYHLGFDASWEPDLFGANGHALAAEQASLGASALTLADVQVSVAAEVARAYIGLRGVQARLGIAGANLASQQEIERLTGWRAQAGLMSELELLQARSATELAAAQLPALRVSQAQWMHSLAVLCGQPPAALDAELGAPGAIPAAAPELALSLPAATLAQRPDVRAAAHRLAAARARVGQADAARYPSLRLEGSLGLNGLGLGGGGSLLRTLLASVAGKAFDSGAGDARLQAQRGALAQAQAAHLAALLTALQEVEDGLAVLAGDQARAGHLRRAAASAAQAALLARQRYASGLADYQSVLETQRTLYAAEDGLALNSADLGTDLVRLYKALGGGWEPGAEVPSEAGPL